MARNFRRLFPGKVDLIRIQSFVPGEIHKEVFLKLEEFHSGCWCFWNGFPSKFFVENWSASVWMKHVVWFLYNCYFTALYHPVYTPTYISIPLHLLSDDFIHWGAIVFRMAFFVVGEVLVGRESLWFGAVVKWVCSFCVPLIPWIFFGEDMKWRFHLSCSWCKVESKTPPYFFGWRKELWSVAFNSESHDQCQMHAFWATHFFLGFFLIYTGYKAGNTCGSWLTANCLGCWSSLSSVFVELKLSCTQLGLHHSITFLEMVCFLS